MSSLGSIKHEFPEVVNNYIKKAQPGRSKAWRMPPSNKLEKRDRIIMILDMDGEDEFESTYKVLWDHGFVQEGLEYSFVNKRVVDRDVWKTWWSQFE